jgi:ubiquinone/menaquinone biosynthesis C-methylase UbiE
MGESVYGQQGAMEDPTMVGTLEAQAQMIWPLERPLLERLGLARARRVLDLGCGTGRIAGRVATEWPHLSVTGVDLFEGHLAVARRDFPAERHPNLAFVTGDARATGLPAASYDAVLIRHMLHALPDPEAVLGEAARLLRPGGLLYELAEDYQGLLIDTADADARDLFLAAAPGFKERGTNLLHGREAYRRFLDAGLKDVRMDAIVVDTLNAPREAWERMFRFWRDGYVDITARALGVPPAEVERRYAAILAAVEDTRRWTGWWLMAVSGRR